MIPITPMAVLAPFDPHHDHRRGQPGGKCLFPRTVSGCIGPNQEIDGFGAQDASNHSCRGQGTPDGVATVLGSIQRSLLNGSRNLVSSPDSWKTLLTGSPCRSLSTVTVSRVRVGSRSPRPLCVHPARRPNRSLSHCGAVPRQGCCVHSIARRADERPHRPLVRKTLCLAHLDQCRVQVLEAACFDRGQTSREAQDD